jgi:hypothetical protein
VKLTCDGRKGQWNATVVVVAAAAAADSLLPG